MKKVPDQSFRPILLFVSLKETLKQHIRLRLYKLKHISPFLSIRIFARHLGHRPYPPAISHMSVMHFLQNRVDDVTLSQHGIWAKSRETKQIAQGSRLHSGTAVCIKCFSLGEKK